MHIEVGTKLYARWGDLDQVWIVERLVAEMFVNSHLDELTVYVHAQNDPRKRTHNLWYYFVPYEQPVEEVVH